MGELKNLDQQEAIKKMKEIAEKIRLCMFCTEVESLPFDVRPMNTMQVDNDGNFWFLSNKTSNKNEEIKENSLVQLLYSDEGSAVFMSVYGHATELYDKQKIEELWNPLIKTWFEEGKDDPNLTVIKVQPVEGYYWDTQHHKMVAFLKMVAASVTGKTHFDDSREGNLNV